MNQGHSRNISHVIVDVDLMVGNVTGDKEGTIAMTSVSASAKNQ